MADNIKKHIVLWNTFIVWFMLLFLGSIIYIIFYALGIKKQKKEIIMIECYSLITILSIIVGGVASLALWYWSGRRPPKKT